MRRSEEEAFQHARMLGNMNLGGTMREKKTPRRHHRGLREQREVLPASCRVSKMSREEMVA